MDSVQFKKYYTTLKNFLLGPKNKEFLIFLFFFFVSAAFWLFQSLNETFDVKAEEATLENMHARLAGRLMNDLYLKAEVKDTRYLFF